MGRKGIQLSVNNNNNLKKQTNKEEGREEGIKEGKKEERMEKERVETQVTCYRGNQDATKPWPHKIEVAS